ncbi:MAG: hypothetical protein O3B86_01305, partial [Planctomycetota bacterium]|nr:hypothetical protein [Planctomycetota bacterium]
MSFAHWLAGFTRKRPAAPRRSRSSEQRRRPARSASISSEYLEERVLLAAASLSGMTLNVVDSGTEANAITMSVSGQDLLIHDSANALSGDASFTAVDSNTVSIPLASVNAASFMLGGGDDSLTLDFANGSPLLNLGITYDGQTNSTVGDSLSLINVGILFATHTYDFTSANDGSITLNDGITDFSIGYVGLEPISNDGSATDIVFNLPAGNNGDVVLNDSASAITGSMLLSGSTFENTTFSSAAATTLTINGNTGDDTITVAGADILFLGTINLNGLDGTDTLTGLNSILPRVSPDHVLTGGGGDDILTGGSGNDLFIWNNGDGSDVIDGGGGVDVQEVNFDDQAGQSDEVAVTDGGSGKVVVSRMATGSLVAFSLDISAMESIQLNLLDGDDMLDASAMQLASSQPSLPQLSITGGGGDDVLLGSGNDDEFIWNNGDGSDVINGGDGRDSLEVNFGDEAGEGDDVTVTGGGRVDITRTAGTILGAFTLDVGTVEAIELNLLAGADKVTATDSPIFLTINGGDDNDTITGSAFDDRINGDDGDDSLMGLNGMDLISGGLGA